MVYAVECGYFRPRVYKSNAISRFFIPTLHEARQQLNTPQNNRAKLIAGKLF